MELKEYQKKVLDSLNNYLDSLNEYKDKYYRALEVDPDIARGYDFTEQAWQKAIGSIHHSHRNGINELVPEFYIKVPTGGGKTFLACHAIDLINKKFLNKQTGLILWIVPTTQIYRQTLINLRNREHPYRQMLDISSGGRTVIKEKMDYFNRLDVEENLVIMLLMLQSSNRQNKETLKVFQDSGSFTDFFPPEDAYKENEEILKNIPNLDRFSDEGGVFETLIKTSLGNTLKILKPLIIIDEGHKAYSEGARSTIRNFNPSVVLELSATPPPDANKLVEIYGTELNEEEMIKLDIHLINKTSLDWKDTMLASLDLRNNLEKKAKTFEKNTGVYIRPINLIQVERTGKDQRGGRFIHAEDVKEYLIKNCSIPEEQIAIKSSEKDDIEGIDLFSNECPIRYIITKQALQEGWDCSFAYVLTILTNPGSQLSITQLIGRILRQPYAQKTKIKELDESYVFCFRQNAVDLVANIKDGLEKEGLGDISGRISLDSDGDNIDVLKERKLIYRKQFKKFEGKIYLPKFVIQEDDSWRDLNFDRDILANIDWNEIKISDIANITLSSLEEKEQEITYGLSSESEKLLEEHQRITRKAPGEIDEVFLVKQLTDIIPNPWIAYEKGIKSLKLLLKKFDKDLVATNIIFIIEELRKIILKEKDILSEKIFKKLITDGYLQFFLIAEKGGFALPSRITVRSNKRLNRSDGTELQLSLFDYVPEEGINELEKSVALYLDNQEKLLWWYRNISKADYHIQGWRKNKIYPDFVTSKVKDSKQNTYGSVHVLETKGLHLKNEDTEYKKSVFQLCNDLGAKKPWAELFDKFADHEFIFQVIYEDEWKNRINQIFEE